MIRGLMHFVGWLFSIEKPPEKVLDDINKCIGSRTGNRRYRGSGRKNHILLP